MHMRAVIKELTRRRGFHGVSSEWILIFPLEIESVLGPVGIHREFITAAAMWIMAAKL
jgi:hypothetical protein